MSAGRPHTALLVFGKSPVPGTVKTRLMPGLSAGQAAALYQRMLAHAMAAATASGLGPVTLCTFPDTNCPYLRRLAGQSGAALQAQVGDDLGQRMLGALRRALDHHSRALLLGSDCPALTPDVLRAADRALSDGADIVLVPAVDGGYALVGGRCAPEQAFVRMPWGTRHVMDLTRARLRQQGVTWVELAPVRDVDRVQDLDLIPPEIRSGHGRAPEF